METKSWYASKTVWFNAAYAIGVVASTVLGYFGYAGSASVSPEVVEGAVLVGAVINLFLRIFYTKQPVG